MVEVTSKVEKVEFMGSDNFPQGNFQLVTLLIEAQELDGIENGLPALVAGQKLTFQVDNVLDENGDVYETSKRATMGG